MLKNFIQDKKEGVFATIHERDSPHDINEMNMEAIFAVMNTTYAVVKISLLLR